MLGVRSSFCVAVQVCACLLFLTAAVTGQSSTTQIVSIAYSGAQCSGTATNTTVNAGDCHQKGNEYIASYCSPDGLSFVTYVFSDASCSLDNVTSILMSSTECNFLSSQSQTICINPAAGPEAPLPFPPQGWLQNIVCLNATNNYKPATTCSSSGDPTIHCVTNAINTDCRPFVEHLYAQYGCIEDGTATGLAIFNDSACSIPVRTETQPVGCYHGVQPICSGEPLPTLPTYGTTKYVNSDCTIGPVDPAPLTVLFAEGECITSEMYTCEEVDGELFGTFTIFKDPTRSGLCPAANNMTRTLPAGKCTNGLIFSCESQSKQISTW